MAGMKSLWKFPGDLTQAYPGTKTYWRNWASELYEVPITKEVVALVYSNEEGEWYCVGTRLDEIERVELEYDVEEGTPHLSPHDIHLFEGSTLAAASPLEVIVHIEYLKQQLSAT